MITKINIRGFKSLKNATVEFYTTKNIADKNKEITRKHKLRNNNFVYTFNLAGIIGTNATGKSSFLDAIFLYKLIVLNKLEMNEKEFFKKYNGLEKQPKKFIFEYLIDGEILKHVLNLDSEFNIVSEELLILESNLAKEKWTSIFFNEQKNSLLWRVAEISSYEKERIFKFNSNELKLINKIFDTIKTVAVFDNNLGFVENDYYLRSLKQRLKQIFKSPEVYETKTEELNLLKLLVAAVDPKVFGFQYNNLSDEVVVLIRDNNKIIEVSFEDLSTGTKRFIYLMFPIFLEKNVERFYLIDEIENSFHPKVIDTILRLFYFNQNNIHNSQFIFTTHNPYIFDTVNIHSSCINIGFYNSDQNFEKLSNFEDDSIKRNDKSFSKKYMLQIVDSYPDNNNINEIYDNFSNTKFYERL